MRIKMLVLALISDVWLLVSAGGASAEIPHPRPFDPAVFEQSMTAQEKQLLEAGKLQTLGSLLGRLKTRPDSKTITLPAVSSAKLDPADLHDKLLASTLVVGLYYRCSDCHQMHHTISGGFAVAENGVVTTCAHVMTLDAKKMLQAYPVAIDAQGKVFPVDQIIAFDPLADTALLHVAGANLPPLPMRTNARVGTPVYCLSHPNSNPFVFTSGMVSRVDTRTEQNRSLCTLNVSCDYSPGSSGCPITDEAGNVLAQVDKIQSQLMLPVGEKPDGPQATVYNLRSATGVIEIARLAEPANRPPLAGEPTVAPDDAAVAHAAPVAMPAAVKDPFIVHSKFDLVLASADRPLDREVKSFADLYQRMHDKQIGVSAYGHNDTPNEGSAPNYVPVGFTGNTGYYQIPGSTEPLGMDNSIARGVDFKITYHDRQETEVGLHVDVNDNRATPTAEDNFVKIDTQLSKNVFSLVKLGPPQKGEQAWLAVLVDNFSAKAALMSVQDGKLPPDKKVDFKFTAADGQEIDTAKMRGKVILVDFWATWCGPCVAALPQIEQLYKQYHDQGLEVLGINLDEERSAMDSFLKKHPHPWPQSVSAASGKNPLSDRFEFHGIPFFLLIDKAGVATIIDARNPNTGDMIAERLKQQG